MVVFAGFVPHPPLAIPEVGKENLESLSETIKAYQNLEQEIYAAKPEVIILIARQGEASAETFAINQQPNLKVNFKDFGDLLTKLQFANDIGLGYQIKEAAETKFPIILTAIENLDYAAGVPLYYLTQHLPDVKIIPISYSKLDNRQHFDFGQHIRRIINKSSKRVAVIASGDLSHKLHQDSPAGYSPRGQEFDQKLVELINNKKIDEVINLDNEFVTEAAGEQALRALLILLGIIKDINYTPEKLSYQSPFGVGYLVANFKLK
jgi:MEMO1 family protein